jgi:hypothetical protein
LPQKILNGFGAITTRTDLTSAPLFGSNTILTTPHDTHVLEVILINFEQVPLYATNAEIVTTSGTSVVLPFGTTANRSTWCCGRGKFSRGSSGSPTN